MPRSARSLMPMISADDIEASLSFYTGLLGGEESFRFPDEGEPAFVALAIGSGELGIGQVDGEPIHGRALRPASGHRIDLCVYVDDVDATVDAARDAGHPIVVEPCAQPWGERIAYVEDPDGNLVMLAVEEG